MSKRIIYRVENAMGIGVWSCGAVQRAVEVAENEDSRSPHEHPGPSSDPKLRDIELDGRLFAFATLNEYRRWFSTPSQRKALTEKGEETQYRDVMLVAYEIDDANCIHGKRQTIFHRRDAIEVARWECDAVETNPEGFQ